MQQSQCPEDKVNVPMRGGGNAQVLPMQLPEGLLRIRRSWVVRKCMLGQTLLQELVKAALIETVCPQGGERDIVGISKSICQIVS